jgi:hypothetical protein
MQRTLGLQTQSKHQALAMDSIRRYFVVQKNKIKLWIEKMERNGKIV